jgi:hypothetical protein
MPSDVDSTGDERDIGQVNDSKGEVEFRLWRRQSLVCITSHVLVGEVVVIGVACGCTFRFLGTVRVRLFSTCLRIILTVEWKTICHGQEMKSALTKGLHVLTVTASVHGHYSRKGKADGLCSVNC